MTHVVGLHFSLSFVLCLEDKLVARLVTTVHQLTEFQVQHRLPLPEPLDEECRMGLFTQPDQGASCQHQKCPGNVYEAVFPRIAESFTRMHSMMTPGANQLRHTCRMGCIDGYVCWSMPFGA